MIRYYLEIQNEHRHVSLLLLEEEYSSFLIASCYRSLWRGFVDVLPPNWQLLLWWQWHKNPVKCWHWRLKHTSALISHGTTKTKILWHCQALRRTKMQLWPTYSSHVTYYSGKWPRRVKCRVCYWSRRRTLPVSVVQLDNWGMVWIDVHCFEEATTFLGEVSIKSKWPNNCICCYIQSKSNSS